MHSFHCLSYTLSLIHILLGLEGAYLDGIYICPHHPHKGYEGEIPELKIDCDCRKPKPGMLLRAAKDFNIDLQKSYMVGDSESDILAGKAASSKYFLHERQQAVCRVILSITVFSDQNSLTAGRLACQNIAFTVTDHIDVYKRQLWAFLTYQPIFAIK